MSTSLGSVLVHGAGGVQGAAVVRAALAAGGQVRVLFEAGMTASLGATLATGIAGFYRWVTEPANGNPLEVELDPVRAALPVPQGGLEQWSRDIPWMRLAGGAQ